MNRIARAICELYPEEHAPEQIAEQLQAVASARGITEAEVLMFLHDRPRQELSTAHFVLWCARYMGQKRNPA